MNDRRQSCNLIRFQLCNKWSPMECLVYPFINAHINGFLIYQLCMCLTQKLADLLITGLCICKTVSAVLLYSSFLNSHRKSAFASLLLGLCCMMRLFVVHESNDGICVCVFTCPEKCNQHELGLTNKPLSRLPLTVRKHGSLVDTKARHCCCIVSWVGNFC